MKIETETFDNGRLFVNREFAGILRDNKLTDALSIWDVSSDPVKKVVKERGTERLFLGNVEFYIKRCSRIPLRERIKSALSLKFRSFDALNEWNALLRFHELGLNTMIPVAAGRLPEGKSFVLSLGLNDYQRASEIFPELHDDTRKKDLIGKIAELAGRMHAANIAHQDFYLVHMFVMNKTDNVFLIDLQRCVMEPNLGRRWIVKDLGQLYFSAYDHIDKKDITLFISAYNRCFKDAKPLDDKKLIDEISRKALKIKLHTDKITKRREASVAT